MTRHENVVTFRDNDEMDSKSNMIRSRIREVIHAECKTRYIQYFMLPASGFIASSSNVDTHNAKSHLEANRTGDQ